MVRIEACIRLNGLPVASQTLHVSSPTLIGDHPSAVIQLPGVLYLLDTSENGTPRVDGEPLAKTGVLEGHDGVEIWLHQEEHTWKPTLVLPPLDPKILLATLLAVIMPTWWSAVQATVDSDPEFRNEIHALLFDGDDRFVPADADEFEPQAPAMDIVRPPVTYENGLETVE